MISSECQGYLKQAYRNEGLVLFLEKKSPSYCCDWITVVIFYTVLHYFFALLRGKGLPLPKSHKGNYLDEGGLELAQKYFYTTKNDIQDSLAHEYAQLFEWSCDIRYKPKSASFTGKQLIKPALQILERAKLIVFNELGYKIEHKASRYIFDEIDPIEFKDYSKRMLGGERILV
ncbi:hypothetical protein KJ665_02770 [Patescibacteria group bacterium]|nr:hypothetical protein [Patescibacteria group bacterium]